MVQQQTGNENKQANGTRVNQATKGNRSGSFSSSSSGSSGSSNARRGSYDN